MIHYWSNINSNKMCIFKKFQCSHCAGDESVGENGGAQESGCYRCGAGKAVAMMIFGAVLIILLIAGSANLIVGVSLKSKEAKNIAAARTMAVSAEGKVTVSSDTASVNFSVITEAKTAKEAQTQNTEKMNKVIEYVKSVGIDPKDIKTTSYYLYPKYDYPNGKSILVGYTLTNSISVKIVKFEVIGDLIAKSVELGINQIGDVNFFVDNPDETKTKAGQLAIQNARAKALALARQAGVRLGKVVSVTESGGELPPYYPMAKEAFGMGGGGGGAPQLTPGIQEIRVVANIVFEIR